MDVNRRFAMSVAMGVFALTLTSWPGTPSRAAQSIPTAVKYVHIAHELEIADAPRLTSFVVRSVNTNERVTVMMNEDVATAESARELARLFRCLRTQKESAIDPRLVTLLARIAEKAGGEIELVSGYRAPKNARDRNFHTRGMAADIRVPNMRTWDVKKLASDLDSPGLGFYPVSKMIHIDVRDTPYKWTDWSGPGK